VDLCVGVLEGNVAEPIGPGELPGTLDHLHVDLLRRVGPDDFTNYAQRMEAAWGRE
jgi:hypothetical protein